MTSRFAALGLCLLMLYFAVHALAGEAGLGAWSDTQAELEERRQTLAALEAEITHLETDIHRLTPGSVDPDYVEMLARERLAFVYPNEIVLLQNRDLAMR